MTTVLIAGNPNAGKTTLFNRLSGARAKTGNYPGITVERRSARVRFGDTDVDLVDVPGTYSLVASSPEEQIAVDALMKEPPAAVVVVVDATALVRGLYLAQQVLEMPLAVVIGLNMMDEARAAGLSIDSDLLAKELGAPVVELVASKGEGIAALGAAVETAVKGPARAAVSLNVDAQTAADVAEVAEVVEGPGAEVWARWALLSLGDDELVGVSQALREVTSKVRARAKEQGRDLDGAIVAARYAQLEKAVELSTGQSRPTISKSRSERWDAVLTHPLSGLLAFSAVMYVVFEALFSWSEPAIGAIEDAVAWSQSGTRSVMPEGLFTDLVVEGILGGVGNVVVFVPQIALLFLMIAFLEDSGYLARVAFLIDRLMKGVGLHGKAFVPLLSGFACAVPAVMATRTIASRRDRLVTMMVLPLMSCSARLPVYVLVIAVVFAGEERIFGLLSVGAVMLFAMYALSVVATLAAAAVLRRTVLKGPTPSLVLELPPYRWPQWRNLAWVTLDRVKSFLVDAGTIILALTIVLWAMLSFPRSDSVAQHAEHQREQAMADLGGEALESELAEIDRREQAELLEHSAGGRLGKAIEPVLEPLGMDWRMGIGVIGAFAAREVFVSTLGVVFGVDYEGEEESVPLRRRLASAERRDGTKLLTPLSGLALMVFFVLACQCMSTIAVVKRESGSWKWPIMMFAYMSTLAYVAALLVYQIGRAMGFS